MAFFKFLQRFSQKEEDPTTNMTVVEFTSWLNSREKVALEGIQINFSDLRTQILEEKNKTKENLTLLINAKLMNEKIPEREKHFMDGNRRAYVQKIESFLDNITGPDIDEIPLDYYTTLEQQFNDFGKNSARNNQILQNFFTNHARSILGNIKQLYKLTKKFGSIVNESKIKEIRYIQKQITNLKMEKIKKKERVKEIENDQQVIHNMQKDVNSCKNKIHEITTSERYTNYTNFLQKKQILTKSKNDIENQFSVHFSTIQVALRKYEHITMDNKIVQQYIDNPIRALHEDQTLKIVEIIVKMNKSIELNKLNLKEIKKRKIVQECSLLTKEFFVNFLTEKIKLVNELTEVETSISSENIIQEITLLERKAKENENAIEITEKSILDLKNQKSPVSSNDIEQMIEEKLDKKVKLILPIQYNN